MWSFSKSAYASVVEITDERRRCERTIKISAGTKKMTIKTEKYVSALVMMRIQSAVNLFGRVSWKLMTGKVFYDQFLSSWCDPSFLRTYHSGHEHQLAHAVWLTTSVDNRLMRVEEYAIWWLYITDLCFPISSLL
jgi:hypothetical protein